LVRFAQNFKEGYIFLYFVALLSRLFFSGEGPSLYHLTHPLCICVTKNCSLSSTSAVHFGGIELIEDWNLLPKVVWVCSTKNWPKTTFFFRNSRDLFIYFDAQSFVSPFFFESSLFPELAVVQDGKWSRDWNLSDRNYSVDEIETGSLSNRNYSVDEIETGFCKWSKLAFVSDQNRLFKGSKLAFVSDQNGLF
jgi:hypothetical protein